MVLKITLALYAAIGFLCTGHFFFSEKILGPFSQIGGGAVGMLVLGSIVSLFHESGRKR